ncbi:hypothetical protein SCUCBS95973_009677 [Sporothrix curviconia]|uniref:Carboxylic ester hydrolase n=1 Tax=Sporothrix curviconia TaxID=1260050 RepID=A0ABP0CXW7_9PEZI
MVALAGAAVQAATITDVCTADYVVASLPANGSILGLTIDPSSVTAAPILNYSTGISFIDICDVNFAYSHDGRDDQVLLNYWMPAPADFHNRYSSTGGEGWNITSLNSSLPGGVEYGAVTGTTDGGFGGFNVTSNEAWLLANGNVNWETIYMFGYQGIYELGVLGKQLTRNFYNMSDETRLYSYYQGCSEGGREGWSQAQRYGDELDGVLVGAPGMRFSFQQIQHLWSPFAEYELGYYPPYCELEQIVNLTQAGCDGLDGKVDGVVARTDLCKLHFNLSTTIGQPYSCAAAAEIPNFMPALPAQNGTITAEGVAVAEKILNGARDDQGRRIYMSYQPTAPFQDAVTAYNETTGEYGPFLVLQSAQWVELGLNLLLNDSALANFDGVTGNTFRNWIATGWQRYQDSLETTWPDLTPFQESGAKVLHYHGESDPQVPPASSVRYYESVRSIMHPSKSYNDSVDALNDFYRFFLIPGAAHCGANPLQPNAPYPQMLFPTLIDWVENGIEPHTLNGTVTSTGEQQQICPWPLRPFWINNGSTLDCQYDQKSLDTWKYDLDAFRMPIF